MAMLSDNANKAAYRIARRQMTNGAKAALLLAMQAKGQTLTAEQQKLFHDMLSSPIGEALICGLLGVALTFAPKISDDPRAKVLAEEFRVEGIAVVGNTLIETALTHVLPILSGALENVPLPQVETKPEPKAKVRVKPEKHHKEDEECEEEEEDKLKKVG